MSVISFLQTMAEALANDAGLIFLIVLMLWSGSRGIWVWKRVVDRLEKQLTEERVEFMGRLNEMREERDRWRAVSLVSGHQRGSTPPPPGPMEDD